MYIYIYIYICFSFGAVEEDVLQVHLPCPQCISTALMAPTADQSCADAHAGIGAERPARRQRHFAGRRRGRSCNPPSRPGSAGARRENRSGAVAPAAAPFISCRTTAT